MTGKNLDEWLSTYATPTRIALDLNLDEWEDEHSALIIVRHQGKVMILNPLALADLKTAKPYLDVDVHAFVDGQDARTGVFGMEEGRRVTFEKDKAPGVSVGWPATKMVVLLLGEQS